MEDFLDLDIKSNLSRAFLYFAPISRKFLILVDNQSWRKNKHSRSTHIRELMITKYRTSPFRNNKTLLRSPSMGHRSSNHGRKKWLPNIDMASLKEKAPFSIMNLYKALHGFIIFEVAWKDVRGINYLNELQKDASLALEVKSVRKWEFSDIRQALSTMSSWFSGTSSERETLQRDLILLYHKVPLHSPRGVSIASKRMLLNDTSQANAALSEDVFFDVREHPEHTNSRLDKDHHAKGQKLQGKIGEVDVDADRRIEAMDFDHTLLLFRFNDRDLPFKLRQIITPNVRLLALLEAGLPPWVIFLQSYPLFCKLYRPWMRTLLRTLYILISLITVIIGFYDLYKNVPLLKATASHLCGPLFNWIEAWDMISRIQYLGTMLFLQNLEKAARWFLASTRMIKMPLLLLTRPLMVPLQGIIEFLSPLWSVLTETIEELCMTAWDIIEPLCTMVLDFLELLFLPLELLYSYTSSLVAMISSLLDSMWDLVLYPTRGCLLLANYVVLILSGMYQVLEGIFNSLPRAKPASSQISFWHSLWNDILSKVFRALRNIIRGFVAFSTSYNQHKLSIYNHLRAILLQVPHLLRLAPHDPPCQQGLKLENHVKVDTKKSDHFKQE